MSSPKDVIGLKGIFAVMEKLTEFGIEFLPTPHTWHFDIMTRDGFRLEIKYANKSRAKSGNGGFYDTFSCKIKEPELKVADFIILVMNTDQGHYFYIIPSNRINSHQIAFNPLSKQRSKYDRYRDRWDFLIRTPKSVGILKYLKGHK